MNTGKIISMLTEKGIVKNIQKSVNVVVNYDAAFAKMTDEEVQKIIDDSVSKILLRELIENDDINDAFVEFANTLAIETIVRDLGIKVDKTFQPEEKDNMIIQNYLKSLKY